MEAWREELYHHGIKGQKWGVRRFQNLDGTLTATGKKHAKALKSNASSSATSGGGGGGGGLTDEEKKKLLEDKPEGVSDEFWLDFKAHGGSLDTFDEAARRKAKIYDMPVGEYQNVTGESGSTGIDWNKKQREVNDTLDRQDQNGAKTTTERQSQNDKSGSSARGKSSSAGNSEEDARRYGEVGTRHRGETLKDTTEMIVAAGHRKRAALTPQGRHEPDNAPASDSMDNRRYAETHTPRGKSAAAGNSKSDARIDNESNKFTWGDWSRPGTVRLTDETLSPREMTDSIRGYSMLKSKNRALVRTSAKRSATAEANRIERQYAERTGKVAPNASQNVQRDVRSNLLDKPDNVSKEYWEEYKSNGGTLKSFQESRGARAEGRVKVRRKSRYVRHSEFTIGGNYLMHYGIKGQKWGIRRYQNADGTLTAAGRHRARRDLSKNDRQRAYAIGRAELAEANYKASRLSDYKKEAEQERKNAEHYAERGRDLVSQFIKAGYNVKSKRVARGTTKLDEFNARTTWNFDKTNWLLRTANNITVSGNGEYSIATASGQAVRGINKYVPGTAYKIKRKKRN